MGINYDDEYLDCNYFGRKLQGDLRERLRLRQETARYGLRIGGNILKSHHRLFTVKSDNGINICISIEKGEIRVKDITNDPFDGYVRIISCYYNHPVLFRKVYESIILICEKYDKDTYVPDSPGVLSFRPQ